MQTLLGRRKVASSRVPVRRDGPTSTGAAAGVPRYLRARPLTVSRPGDRSERRADELASGTRGARDAIASARGSAPSSEARSLVAGLGGGRRLSADERAPLESRFGVDLSDVHIHEGPEAEEAAASFRARAFTVGDHVAFGSGQYRPGSADGRQLLAHEVAHAVAPGPADVQRSPIADNAPLADFVALTQQAIDGVVPGGTLTVGPEVVQLLTGLRGHVSLVDATGRRTRNGGSFTLSAGGNFTGLGSALTFSLVVDDTATPSLGGRFGAGELRVEAAHFRGGDTDALGLALFHEAVHALMFIQRARPSVTLRADAARGLDLSRHDHFRADLARRLDQLFPGDARNARVTSGLVEEIVAIVETEVYEATASGQPGIGMLQGSFNASMRGHLFEAGIFYTHAEGARLAGDPRLDTLLAVLYRYYQSWSRRRRFEAAIFGSGMHLTGDRPPSTWEPTLPGHRSFIPEIARDFEESGL